MSRFGPTFDCPLCGKQIEPPHVKRHLRTHDAIDKEASDIAWVRWLERTDEISVENAAAMVEIIEKRQVVASGCVCPGPDTCAGPPCGSAP